MANKIIAQFPAYTIVEADPTHVWENGEEFAIPYETQRYGTMYRFYTLGSAENFYRETMQYCEEEVALRIRRSKEAGHELWFAIQLSTILSDPPPPHKTVVGLKHGDVISFMDKWFTINPAPNHNICLVEV